MIAAAFKIYVKIMELWIGSWLAVYVQMGLLETDVRQGLTHVTESSVIIMVNLTMIQSTVFVEKGSLETHVKQVKRKWY